MRRFWSILAEIRTALVNWLQANLILLMVVASAWHYIRVLAEFDPWPVAIAIGVVVDLGIYEAVMIAARYRVGERSGNRREQVGRWVVALGMTAISGFYHLQYYWKDFPLPSWPLALPLPILICALAYFEKKDAHLRGGGRSAETITTTVEEIPSQGIADEKDDTADGIPDFQREVWRYLGENPDAKLKEIAEAVGCSQSTASRYRKAWKDNGRPQEVEVAT